VAVLLVVVGAMLAAVLFAGAGDRLRLPWPVLLLLLGAAAAFVPGIEAPDIEPDLILPLFLPPLLYATAQRTSWALFRLRWRTIAFLAVGLVVVTVAAVAGTLVALTGIGVAAALAIGAAVAPPDPVAVEAVAGPLRVPRRIMATLQSEGLFNDATALVAYKVGVTAVVSGTFSLANAGLKFVGGAAGGIAIGLAVGWVVAQLRARTSDTQTSITISLFSGYAAFIPADALGVSGVLAAVTTGIYMGVRGPSIVPARIRLQGFFFWEMLDYLLNASLFVLVGLQLRGVVNEIEGQSLWTFAGWAAAIVVVVILTRIVWGFTIMFLY